MADKDDWFKKLFYEQYPKLCRLAHRYIVDQSVCEDIVQECFISFWEQHEDKNVLNAAAYLSTMVKNKCISHERKQVYHTPIEEEKLQIPEMPEAAEGDRDKKDTMVMVKEVLSLLPAKCRVVFEMSRLENKTYQQIAAELDLSVKTIENQMGKAIKIMRQYVQQHPDFFVLLVLCLLNF